MDQCIAKHGENELGVLNGWDRIVFRGTYCILCVASGMMKYLWESSGLLKEFGAHAEAMTAMPLEAARREERPVRYRSSSAARKEDRAKEILRDSPVESGPVCVLKCVEPCKSYEIHRNRDTKKLELRPKQRKGLHGHRYYLDPAFGLMKARIQTRFPFSTQICLNGREWLARRHSRQAPGQRKLRENVRQRPQHSARRNDRQPHPGPCSNPLSQQGHNPGTHKANRRQNRLPHSPTPHTPTHYQTPQLKTLPHHSKRPRDLHGSHPQSKANGTTTCEGRSMKVPKLFQYPGS